MDHSGARISLSGTFDNLLLRLAHEVLLVIGYPVERIPRKGVTWFLSTALAIAIGAAAYSVHLRKLQNLERRLLVAEANILYLRENRTRKLSDRPVRIFMDGAFDLLHYGHMNAFRLGKALGTHLVVGVNSDDSIKECKGSPLMNDHERLTMVSCCKFVDEVVPGCPYIMNEEYLAYVIDKYDIDYVVHGDDPCIVNGKDVYDTAKKLGKYKSIPRTEGVSTTDIMGRMLLMSKEHHLQGCLASREEQNKPTGIDGSRSKLLATSRMLQLFGSDVSAPRKSDRIVYVDGSWDLFHPRHVSILKRAKELGDYLIVGVFGDSLVNELYGMNLPLMNLHERVLSVMGCRFVDDVLIDAPYFISEDMISRLNISEVVVVTENDFEDLTVHDMTVRRDDRLHDVAHAGILREVDTTCDFDLSGIVDRIVKNQEEFQARFNRKMASERVHFQQQRNR